MYAAWNRPPIAAGVRERPSVPVPGPPRVPRPVPPPASDVTVPTLLALRHVRKTFPGVVALDDVDFELQPGTVHALVGENGAGKSTIVNLVAGALQPDAGAIEIDGHAVRLRDAHAARAHGIAVVHQELQLAADLSAAENVFLGRWPVAGWLRRVDRARLHADAATVLARIGADLDVTAPVRALPIANTQMVEIALALSLDARVLLLDEPSAILTPHELARLFAIVRDLRARGVGIVYISHRLAEIFAIADEVTVLRDGRRVASRPVSATTPDDLVRAMVGREIVKDTRRHFVTKDGAAPEAASNPTVLRVEALTAPGRFHDITLDVRAGEILALAGLVGAGRSS